MTDPLEPVEHRAREAIAARVAEVGPLDPAGLQRVEQRIVSRRRNRALAVLGSAAAVVVAVAAIAMTRSGSNSVVVTASTSTTPISTGATATTSVAANETTTPSTTPSTTAMPALRRNRAAMYPAAGIGANSPEEAALGFAALALGQPEATIELADAPCCAPWGKLGAITPFPGARAGTQLLIEQEEGPDLRWYVTAVNCDDIQIGDAHVAGGQIVVSGISVAFEATIQVQVRSLTTGEVLASSIAMGGATEPAPFSASIPVPAGDGPWLLVVRSPDASGHGEATQAAAVRVGG